MSMTTTTATVTAMANRGRAFVGCQQLLLFLLLLLLFCGRMPAVVNMCLQSNIDSSPLFTLV